VTLGDLFHVEKDELGPETRLNLRQINIDSLFLFWFHISLCTGWNGLLLSFDLNAGAKGTLQLWAEFVRTVLLSAVRADIGTVHMTLVASILRGFEYLTVNAHLGEGRGCVGEPVLVHEVAKVRELRSQKGKHLLLPVCVNA
jgi:hypothetical protein